VIQHFILFLKDARYTPAAASRFSTGLLASSLGGRVLSLCGRSLPKIQHHGAFLSLDRSFRFPCSHGRTRPAVLWTFAIVFGFSMGADYMLIPLVTAECFGTASLGQLLALIIMATRLANGELRGLQEEYSMRGTVMTWRGRSWPSGAWLEQRPSTRCQRYLAVSKLE